MSVVAEVALLSGVAGVACKAIQNGVDVISNSGQRKRDLELARTRVAALERELAEAKAQGSASSDKVLELEKSLKGLIIAVVVLQKKSKDAAAAAAAVEAEASAQLAAAHSELAQRDEDVTEKSLAIEGLRGALAALREQLSTLSADLSDGAAREARLADDLAAAQQDTASLRAQLDELVPLANAMGEALGGATANIESVRDEGAAALQAAHAAFEKQLAAITAEMEELRVEMTAQLEAKDLEVDAARAEALEAQQATQAALETANTLSSRVSEIEVTLDKVRGDAEKDKAALREQNAAAAADNERLAEQAAAKDTELEALRAAKDTELEALRAALAKANADNEEVCCQRDAHARHVVALETAFEKELAESAEVAAANKKLKEENAALRRENEAAAARALALEKVCAEAKQAQAQAEEKANKASNTSKKKTAIIGKLQKEVEQLQVAAATAQAVAAPEQQQQEREVAAAEDKENVPDVDSIICDAGRPVIASSVDARPRGRAAYAQRWETILQAASRHPGLFKSMSGAMKAAVAGLDEAQRLEVAICRDGSAALAVPGSEADVALKSFFTNIYGSIRQMSTTLAALNATPASQKAAAEGSVLEEEALLGWALRQLTIASGLLAKCALPESLSLAEANAQLVSWVKEVCSGVCGRVVALAGYGSVGYGLTYEEVAAHAREAVAQGQPRPEVVNRIICTAVRLPSEAAPTAAVAPALATEVAVEAPQPLQEVSVALPSQQLVQEPSADQKKLLALLQASVAPVKTRPDTPAAPTVPAAPTAPAAPTVPAAPVSYLAMLKKQASAQPGSDGSGSASAASSPKIGVAYGAGGGDQKKAGGGGGNRRGRGQKTRR